jgi:hypothetical protein
MYNESHEPLLEFGFWLRDILDKGVDKLRLKDKPAAATVREWREWRNKASREQPVAYWLNETASNWIRRRVRRAIDPFNNARYYFRCRFMDRYHVVPTGLESGRYHDCDERILHGMFTLLVDFVEVEKAWMNVVFSREKRAKYRHPWWSLGWTRFKSFRDPAAGLDHLRWEAMLDDPKLSEYERSDEQARQARELLALYDWWKNIRPQRKDPNDASGWSEFCDRQHAARREKYGKDLDPLDFLDHEDDTEEEQAESLRIIYESQRIEREYETEDQDMLIRLIKIRKGMWT